MGIQTRKSLKHWCVTELGEENDRIHLHGIVFGQRAAELIKQQWGYGIVYVGKYCSSRTANYITKYMLKEDVKHPWFTGRVFTSEDYRDWVHFRKQNKKQIPRKRNG